MKRDAKGRFLVYSKCGCKCNCHVDEGKPEWPGPCAGCCEAFDPCSCGVALAKHEMALAFEKIAALERADARCPGRHWHYVGGVHMMTNSNERSQY